VLEGACAGAHPFTINVTARAGAVIMTKRRDGQAMTSYESFSKRTHRDRIVHDMIAHHDETSLLMLASPGGQDVAFFGERVARMRCKKLVAVNRGPISFTPKSAICKKRVLVLQHTEFESVLEGCLQECKTYSHIWLDGTAVDIGITDLQRAIACATSKLYVVVNLSRCKNGLLEARTRMEIRCRLFGVSVEHEEAYKGTGGKRSMVFFAIDVTGKKTDVATDQQIGRQVWIKAGAPPYDDGYALVADKGALYYPARVVGVDHEAGEFVVQFYDIQLSAARAFKSLPAKKSHVSVRRTNREPMVERYPMAEVRGEIARRRGDVNCDSVR